MNKLWWQDVGNLDEVQKKILKLPPSGRYYVTGPAGSGKTNILVLRAKSLLKQKVENYAVLVYNGPLERFVSSDEKYGIREDKVFTFVSWMMQQLRSLLGDDGFVDLPGDLDERRNEVCMRMLRHLDESGKRDLIDTILVDEIQDYTPNEVRLLGLVAKNVFFAGDVRQQIYKSHELSRAIDAVVPKDCQFELKSHYRIGEKICVLADRIAKPSKGHKSIIDGCAYDESKGESSVTRHQATLAEQLKLVARAIEDQLDAYPDEFIGVMCPTNETLLQLANFMMGQFGKQVTVQQAGNYKNFSSESPIVCSTLHNGKGIEYRCVHIIATERLAKMPRNRELIYTGITRAKTSLTIYHDRPLPGYLEDAIVAGEVPLPIPPIESLFD